MLKNCKFYKKCSCNLPPSNIPSIVWRTWTGYSGVLSRNAHEMQSCTSQSTTCELHLHLHLHLQWINLDTHWLKKWQASGKKGRQLVRGKNDRLLLISPIRIAYHEFAYDFYIANSDLHIVVFRSIQRFIDWSTHQNDVRQAMNRSHLPSFGSYIVQ